MSDVRRRIAGLDRPLAQMQRQQRIGGLVGWKV
jgi:hypothetical protein